MHARRPGQAPPATHGRRFAGASHWIVLALLSAAIAGEVMAQGPACPPPTPGRLFANGFDLPPGGDLALRGNLATQAASGTVIRGSRTIPWSAHLPMGAGGPWPWLVFAPGFNIPRTAYASLGDHLASHGFAVVRAEPEASFINVDHVAMAADLRAVVDALTLPQALPVAIDATRTALGGHSLGGKLAVLAASGDARVRAVLLLDPVNASNGMSNQPGIVPQPTGALAIPLGILGETLDAAGAMACAPAAINYRTIFDAALGTPRGYEWTLDGASHVDFVSDPDACGLACSFCMAPTLPPAQTRAFVRSASTAFLETHLRGSTARCEWLTGAEVPGYVAIRVR